MKEEIKYYIIISLIVIGVAVSIVIVLRASKASYQLRLTRMQVNCETPENENLKYWNGTKCVEHTDETRLATQTSINELNGNSLFYN